MNTPFRFIDGLAEDMVGYIFPAGNAVGIPTPSNPNPSDTDRFGCGHSDDSESTSGQRRQHRRRRAGQAARRPRRHRPSGSPTGGYVLPGGTLSRDPLGGPEIKCNVNTQFHAAGPAHGRSSWPMARSIAPAGAGCR